jgi:hypothetical protein
MLLGLVFLVFGLNAFLQFLKGPIPGLPGQFFQALFQLRQDRARSLSPSSRFSGVSTSPRHPGCYRDPSPAKQRGLVIADKGPEFLGALGG